MATISEMYVEIGAKVDEFEREVAKMKQQMQDMQKEMGGMAQQTQKAAQGMAKDWQYMSQEMQNAYTQANEKMRPFREEMEKTEYAFFKMAQGAKDFKGSNQDFINEIEKLGKAQKTATDNMMKNNDLLKQSFYESVGTMLNMSSQASKVLKTYESIGNPLYSVNNGFLQVADSMHKMAMAGQPAALALKMLGPTADMKQLNDLTRQITTSLMAYPIAAMVAAGAAIILYGALHQAAMGNEEYKNSFETMLAKLREAFQPMVDVFSTVMTGVYKFITAIAELMIAFNEAHPTIAKVLQGFLMLIPALTLILLPLGIGIGLVNGMAASFGLLWTTIGPVITFFASFMGTVLLVAGAIAVLVGGINYLWKTNEGFKNAVTSAWDFIYSKAMTVFGMIPGLIAPVIEKFQQLGEAIKLAFSGDFSQISTIFSALLPTLVSILLGGIPGLIVAVSQWMPAIAEGITMNVPFVTTAITDMINNVVTFITTWLPIFVEKGIEIITNLINGIVQTLPQVVEAFVGLVENIVPPILGVLPAVLDAGIEIILALIEGILDSLPKLIDTASELITTLVGAISDVLPTILDAGMEILNVLIEGIMKVLPDLVETAIELITKVVDTLTENLPRIIDSGVKILTKLIEGITKVLPDLIDMAVKLIEKIVQTLADNLPQIIEAGIKILNSLIEGINEVLPDLLKAALKLITEIVKVIVDNLPDILKAGADITEALNDGIKSMVDALLSSVKSEVVDPIVDKAREIIGDMKTAGSDIIQGLINGLTSKAKDLFAKAGEIASTVTKTIKDAFKVKSPSRVTFAIGEFVGQGLEKGLHSSIVDLQKESDRLAVAATPNINGVSNALNISPVDMSGQTKPMSISVMLDSYLIGRTVAPVVGREITVYAGG